MKKVNLILTILILGTLAMAHAQAQSDTEGNPERDTEGTNVGSGGSGTNKGLFPHQHEQSPSSPYHHHPLEPGEKQFTDSYWDTLWQWSSSASAILTRQKGMALVARGGFDKAREELVKGLDEVVTKYQDPDRPIPFELLTARSAYRGYILNDILTRKDKDQKAQLFEDQVVTTFLSYWYTFIINVNIQFDQRFSIPMAGASGAYCTEHVCPWDAHCPDCRQNVPCRLHMMCPTCHRLWVAYNQFYVEFDKYVHALLDFTLDRLGSMGDSTYQLILLEHISKWASEDLLDSIFRERYAYTGKTLADLSVLICQFLNGEDTPFGDNPMWLVWHAQRTLRPIVTDLENTIYGRERRR